MELTGIHYEIVALHHQLFYKDNYQLLRVISTRRTHHWVFLQLLFALSLFLLRGTPRVTLPKL